MTLAIAFIDGGVVDFAVTGAGTGTALSGVPNITELGGVGKATGATFFNGVLSVTFDFTPTSETVFLVPGFDQALRTSTGGYLAQSRVSSPWQPLAGLLLVDDGTLQSGGGMLVPSGVDVTSVRLRTNVPVGSQAVIVVDSSAVRQLSVRDEGDNVLASVLQGAMALATRQGNAWEVVLVV